jgi:hypothetical protein
MWVRCKNLERRSRRHQQSNVDAGVVTYYARQPVSVDPSFTEVEISMRDLSREAVIHPASLTLVLTLSLTLVVSCDAMAQAPAGQAVFERLMNARMDSLAREPAIAARAPGKHGLALMASMGDSALYFLDDEGLRQLGGLLAETAARAAPDACARLFTSADDAFSAAFGDVLQSADSVLLDRWATLTARLVRAGIIRSGPGRLATPDEMTSTIVRIVAQQSVGDQQRLKRGATRTGDASDLCFFVKTIYGQLGSLAAAESGPVFRAMMNGVVPRLP